jgi:xanthine dehydrogenase/oxidase
VFDIGKSINPTIDVGQIEGAFIQGYGWMTMEELIWGDADHKWVKPGHMLTAGPGNYKIPSLDDIPRNFGVTLVNASENSQAIHSSRGVGEPPLLLSASVVFALRDAVAAARKDYGKNEFFQMNLPLTAERIRMACADNITELCVKESNGRGNHYNFQARGSW